MTSETWQARVEAILRTVALIEARKNPSTTGEPNGAYPGMAGRQ